MSNYSEATNRVIAINYNGSVLTPAGWRGVVFSATVERISPKRVKIVQVTAIDGEHIARNMSRTGTKRQNFNGLYFANKETGKVKNISIKG